MCLCVRPQQLHIKNLLPYFMCDISEIEDVTNYLAPFIHKLSLHSIMWVKKERKNHYTKYPCRTKIALHGNVTCDIKNITIHVEQHAAWHSLSFAECTFNCKQKHSHNQTWWIWHMRIMLQNIINHMLNCEFIRCNFYVKRDGRLREFVLKINYEE